ncbi:hypothetical protein MSG28_008240, partial [Choristoneura fumiferana]
MVAAMDTPHFPVQVDGKNYDIKKFLRDHPGGVNTLKHYEGKSILQAMEKFGHSISAYHMLNDFKVDSSDLKDCNLTGSVSENGRIITNEEGSRDKAEVAYLEELEGRLDWSKPILCQLDTIAPDYEKWVNSAVFRHCRIFSSPLLEAMTFTPWYLVPAFWIPIILYLGYTQFSEHVLSYLVYDMIHYYVHHGSPQDGTYLYTMKRYHSNHHFVNHDKDEEGPITSQLVTESLRCGREISRASARRGNDLVRSGVSLEYSTPAMLHLFSGKLPADAKAAAEVSHEILTATKLLQLKLCSTFLDGSHIYGTDPSAAKKLRTLSGGKLKEETRKHCQRGFLPTVDVKSDVCDLRNSSEPCYLAEHNRIATILGSLNPMWSDEKIYQEARRIVIAELQHITYQEWLPLNFGENYFRYYRISPSSLYSRDYSDAVHPGVINSFGHAAFRYLHSMRINALAQFYECVDDIDLFVGGSLESDVPGSILGHTFQCIVAEQFYRTRVGDRFFYDNIEQPHSFTSGKPVVINS